MKTTQIKPKSIDEYISGFPSEIQEILKKIRKIIKTVAPEAQETIKYHMPTFTLKGNLVYFAAFKHHIGFYPPVSTGSPQIREELTLYEGPKKSFIFPLDKPIPYELIRKLVELRVSENNAKAIAKLKE